MPRTWLALAALVLTTATGCGATTNPTAQPSPSVGDGQADFGQAPADETVSTPSPEPPGQPEQPQDDGVPAEPSAEDCVSFNPSNLTVTASGDAWILRDGSHSMLLFDTQADANDAKQVARNWTRLCFIGRANQQADRYRYIITYWKTPSGLPLGTAPSNECISYQPSTLAIYSGAPHPADPDQSDWALHAGATPLLYLATESDALRAKLVATGFTKLCLIGHGNTRPNPVRYIAEYWRS